MREPHSLVGEHMAGSLMNANVVVANATIGTHFMVDDIVHTPPMNPLVPGSGSGATQATMN